MTKNEIIDEYFEWLYRVVCGERYESEVSYRKLLTHLHEAEFTYILPMDENRAGNGINLRYRWALDIDEDTDYILDVLDGPCSVLEMMVALALHCEENIMDDPKYGNRTGQWFWGMVNSLGLGAMYDELYDERYVDEVITRFLNREYERDGRGGLFTIKNCKYDLRDVEIWHQLNWYLSTIV